MLSSIFKENNEIVEVLRGRANIINIYSRDPFKDFKDRGLLMTSRLWNILQSFTAIQQSHFKDIQIFNHRPKNT